MMTFLNVLLGLSAVALAASLGYALKASRYARIRAMAELPDRLRDQFSVIFATLWFVVTLLAVGGTGRLIYAAQDSHTTLSIVFTAVVTTLSCLACYHTAMACWRLHRAGA